jgi:hypothetical protein
MKYLLLIYFEEKGLSEPEREACYAESLELAHEIHASGQYLGANLYIRHRWRPASVCARANGW